MQPFLPQVQGQPGALPVRQGELKLALNHPCEDLLRCVRRESRRAAGGERAVLDLPDDQRDVDGQRKKAGIGKGLRTAVLKPLQ